MKETGFMGIHEHLRDRNGTWYDVHQHSGLGEKYEWFTVGGHRRKFRCVAHVTTHKEANVVMKKYRDKYDYVLKEVEQEKPLRINVYVW